MPACVYACVGAINITGSAINSTTLHGKLFGGISMSAARLPNNPKWQNVFIRHLLPMTLHCFAYNDFFPQDNIFCREVIPFDLNSEFLLEKCVA